MSKRESILDLGKFMNQQVLVKFQGGREVVGVLKGYDTLVNLVLDEAVEMPRDGGADGGPQEGRKLGLCVCRGTSVTTVSPPCQQIENPFAT